MPTDRADRMTASGREQVPARSYLTACKVSPRSLQIDASPEIICAAQVTGNSTKLIMPMPGELQFYEDKFSQAFFLTDLFLHLRLSSLL